MATLKYHKQEMRVGILSDITIKHITITSLETTSFSVGNFIRIIISVLRLDLCISFIP